MVGRPDALGRYGVSWMWTFVDPRSLHLAASRQPLLGKSQA